MKRFLIYLPIILLAVFSAGNLYSQVNGDYRSRQSGNYNVRTTWERYNGSTWVSPAPSAPPSTTISTRITVRSGHTVTATANLRATGSSATLIVDNGGTLSMGSFTISGSNTLTNRFPTVTINGTLTTTNSLTARNFTIGSTGYFRTGYIGANGWWNTTNTPITVSISGTVEFSGANNQRVPAYTYGNIIVSGSGTKPLSGNITLTGLLTVNSGVTFSITTRTITLRGTGLTLNGTLLNTGATLNFDGTTQTFTGTGTVSGNLNNLRIGTNLVSSTTFSLATLLTVNNLRIDRSPNLGSLLTISPTSSITVLTSLDLFRPGGLVLKSDATGTASMIVATTGINGGTAAAIAELYLTGAPGGTMYHYISSPVNNVQSTLFSSMGIVDVMRYREDLITTDKGNGWVAYDGWHYNVHTRAWEDLGAAYQWTTLVAATGYNYYSSSDKTLQLQGRINTGNFSTQLAFNSGNTTPNQLQHGWNLIGNPYTSGLDWDAVVAANNIWTSVGAAIYFRRNGVMYTYVNGVTVPNDFGSGDQIPPMQGFFIKSESNGVILNIPASARIHTTHARYKSSSIEKNPLLRLNILFNGKSDQALIRIIEDASEGFDKLYDSGKLFPQSSYPALTSIAGGQDLIVNTIPVPDSSAVILLNYIAPSAGTYTISAAAMEGFTYYNVYLKDKITGSAKELSPGEEYTFSSEKGSFPGRFEIILRNNTPATTPEPVFVGLKAWHSSGIMYLIINDPQLSDVTGIARIFDITGKIHLNGFRIPLENTNPVEIPFDAPAGIYIIELQSGGKRYTAKVAVR